MTASFRFVLDEQAVEKLLRSEDGPVGKALLRAALSAERMAKRLCPVDTGRLRGSINHELARGPNGLEVSIGTDVEYAPFVELGTSRMAARPFLRPALLSVAGRGF